MLAWYVAIGTARGGEWDFEEMTWTVPIPPKAVYAIPAEMKK